MGLKSWGPKPWTSLAVPHRDIREGKLDESVFAADLSDVLENRGPLEYRDAGIFFGKTYPTLGLVSLLATVLSRLSGQGGEPVIQLQTPFGGGKTHSLIALYHLFRSPQEAADSDLGREALNKAGLEKIPEVSVVAFVGTVPDPIKGRTPWGEIAYQLGRYELMKDLDKRRRAPGKDLLHQVLGDQPVLILMDEIAEYTVKARDFDDQVLAFFQELTETVKVLPRCALVVTLPSSAPYGDRGEQVLERLQRIFGRMEAIYTPVTGEEIYEVIRKRLFEDLPDQREMNGVASDYWKFYQELGEDIPREAREPDYKNKMVKAYPFHPEVIDTLFERWSTYPTFQRTRGVLRLLAEVVSDLYQKSHSAPLILPAHINLANSTIRSEFLKHIGSEYEGVIASDIADTSSKAREIDRQMGPEYSRFNLAQGLATAIFFGSFSAGERQGVSIAWLRLAVLQPDIPPALVTDALKRLEDSLWYLHVEKGLYAFRSQPNLNRVVIQREETIKEEQIWNEVHSRLKELAGKEMEVILWPSDPADVPDTKALKLALLGPEHLASRQLKPALAGQLLEKSGTTFRVYRNALLVLAMDEGEWSILRRQVRSYLAWKSIQEDKELVRTLNEDQRRTVGEKLKDFEGNIRDKLLSAYRHLARAADGDIEWHDLGLPTTRTKVTLAGRVMQYLKSEDLLVEQIKPEALLSKALKEDEKEKAVKEVVEAFLRYPHLPILASEEVVWRAIEKGVQDGVFGLRLGEKVYFRESLILSGMEEDAVLVRRELVPPPPEAKVEAVTPGVSPQAPSEAAKAAAREGEVAVLLTPAPTAIVRRLRARIPWNKLSDFMRGVISPIRDEGAELDLEVLLEARGSISKETIEHKVRETLRQIGAEVLEDQLD